MAIYEIEVPGLSLVGEDPELNFKVKLFLTTMRSRFYELNLAINKFVEVKVTAMLLGTESRAEFFKQREIRDRIRAELEAKLPPYENRRDFGVRGPALNFEVEGIYKKMKWAAGDMPSEFALAELFMHARSFVNSLDVIERLLGKLVQLCPGNESLKGSHELLVAKFPDLRKVRNSTQHMEQRLQGEKNFGKPIPFKPINHDGIIAPNGGLIFDVLNGSKFGTVMEDGEYGEVDVSECSAETVRDVLEKAYASFEWFGGRFSYPSA